MSLVDQRDEDLGVKEVPMAEGNHGNPEIFQIDNPDFWTKRHLRPTEVMEVYHHMQSSNRSNLAASLVVLSWKSIFLFALHELPWFLLRIMFDPAC